MWHWLPSAPSENPDSLEIMKLAATFVAGLGGIVALTVAYRKQREQELRRDSLRLDAAAQQLGSDDGAIRLAGVYAAAALADESARLRPAVVQLMCAYLRLNRASDGPVQQTILEAIAQRTQRSAAAVRSWSAYNLDLHGIVVGDRLGWINCRFDGTVNLEGVTFQHDVQMVMTEFNGQLVLNEARFERQVMAFYARFNGTVLMNKTVFNQGIGAIGAHFSGGLQANSAEFRQGATFSRSQFTNGATFSRSKFDGAAFDHCVFARGTAGHQSDAVHNGDAYFRGAHFDGANFSDTVFRAKAWFDDAEFSGDAPTFASVRFLDGGSIERATFPGTVPEALRELATPEGAGEPRS
ncbi:pentapeptide repeat-containing protein [Cellulomonas sp. KRMCY2]|uniref:pentapeptide repeat-containing protein n=1 Tax=Cellulomonas sp. KRMCY2 TaxID=1304865 RepID=UPI0018CC6119|nr:pentapeptide repeat-containing protein [Cellulomonas sp. KRMCY2]